MLLFRFLEEDKSESPRMGCQMFSRDRKRDSDKDDNLSYSYIQNERVFTVSSCVYDIESLISNFWWRSLKKDKGIH